MKISPLYKWRIYISGRLNNLSKVICQLTIKGKIGGQALKAERIRSWNMAWSVSPDHREEVHQRAQHRREKEGLQDMDTCKVAPGKELRKQIRWRRGGMVVGDRAWCQRLQWGTSWPWRSCRLTVNSNTKDFENILIWACPGVKEGRTKRPMDQR